MAQNAALLVERDPSTAPALRKPDAARQKLALLAAKREELQKRSVRMAREFEKLNAYLAVADKVTAALEQLNEQLFRQLLSVVEEKLTIALQEILEQPISFHASADFKRGAASVEFWVQRDGNREDVLRGQGGSVANILSVGLRLFALTTLDESQHRRFLVLDEQDCWLRPELVPRLVKIIHDASHALGFQVLLISHHDVAIFEQYADRIYQCVPVRDGGVQVRLVSQLPVEQDAADQAE